MSDYPCGAKRLRGEPASYLDWPTWADKKLLTHKQAKCTKCGIWHKWIRKVERTNANDQQD